MFKYDQIFSSFTCRYLAFYEQLLQPDFQSSALWDPLFTTQFDQSNSLFLTLYAKMYVICP